MNAGSPKAPASGWFVLDTEEPRRSDVQVEPQSKQIREDPVRDKPLALELAAEIRFFSISLHGSGFTICVPGFDHDLLVGLGPSESRSPS